MTGAIIAEENNVKLLLIFDRHTNLIHKYIVIYKEECEVFYSFSKAENRFRELVRNNGNK